jgi:hypothetical protein
MPSTGEAAYGVAPRLTVDRRGHHLLADDRPTFLLADTLWAAFGRMNEDEWTDTLRLRRRQGFNAVNISVLPIAHDRSFSERDRVPFAVREDGSWDLDRLDLDYFRQARRMVQLAHEHGIITVLVAVWCTYVPGTWASERAPDLAMSTAQTDRYLDVLVETFADLRPIFCASGDDDLTGDVALSRYRRILHRLKVAAPDCLTTVHSTPRAFLPRAWAEDDALDLYAYQSGHDDGWAERAIDLPLRYAALTPGKPILSMEPCYEGHGFGGGRARHDARHVRRASWSGLLAGAGAGLGYAAHGAWSWHRAGEEFTGESFSGIPLPASRAMELPGAWDVGLLRRLVEAHCLYDLISRQDLVVDDSSGARFAMSEDQTKAVAFLPEAFRLRLDLDLSDWEIEVWDLDRSRRDHVSHVVVDGQTIFEQPDVTEDLVYLMRR